MSNRRTPPALRGRTTLRRALLATVSIALAPALVLSGVGIAQAATTRDRSDAAAGWLGRQVPADGTIRGAFGADYGLTADTVLGLDSAKVGRAAAGRATNALKGHVVGYTGGGDSKEFYAGSFAKLLLVAAAQQTSARHFGSGPRRDLVANLRRLQKPSGRFSDKSRYGDFSNTFSQSLALMGLERTTTSGPSHAAVLFLRRQQCGNGAFPEAFGGTGCKPSVDATGFAVQALFAAGGAPARTDARQAATWLKRHQNANGSFTGNGTQNANSTALAAQALRVAGRTAAADKAVAFLRTLQQGCKAAPANRGRVRYDRSGGGDPLRATAQAVPALAGVGLMRISKAGSVRTLPTLRCS